MQPIVLPNMLCVIVFSSQIAQKGFYFSEIDEFTTVICAALVFRWTRDTRSPASNSS